MPDSYTHPRSRTAGATLGLLSLVVAALSLSISVFTFFNGSAKQARFEADRQLCVDALNQYGRTLLDIRFSDERLNSGQQADWIIDSARARISCFDTGVLDSDSQFLSDWITTESILELPIGFLGTEFVDEVLSGASEDIANSAIDRLLDALDDALSVALTAPGPGFFFWEDATPTAPTTFPPFQFQSPPPNP